MALRKGYVELEDFNNEWALNYEKEKELLCDVLKNKIIEIHHIGSTSINGLKAKPIIDILITLESLDNIEKIEDILKDYGYTNRGPQGVPDRFFFAKGSEDARTHYIHFTTPNSNTYYNQVYFKRYLNEHEDVKEEYSKLKEKLAKEFADDRPKYTKGKSEFISNVIKLAKEEYDD